MSIYSDPNLQQEDDFPDQVTFNQRGDRVRARIVRFAPLPTRYGVVAKYWLFDLDRQIERTMLAGAKNLWGQLLSLQPMPGDVVDIELIDFAKNENGTAKLFEVSVERVGEVPQTTQSSRPFTDEDSSYKPQAAPSRPVADDEDEDLFAR